MLTISLCLDVWLTLLKRIVLRRWLMVTCFLQTVQICREIHQQHTDSARNILLLNVTTIITISMTVESSYVWKVGNLYSWKLRAVVGTYISKVLISLNIHKDRTDTDKSYLQNVLVYSSGREKMCLFILEMFNSLKHSSKYMYHLL
jgi:hypothetical protein